MPLTSLLAVNLIIPFAVSFIGLFFLYINTVLFLKDKTVNKKVAKVFLLYLFTLAIVETICNSIGVFSYLLELLKPEANFFVSHFYFGFQFIFLSYLFYILIDSKRIKKIILTVFCVEMLLLLYSYISEPAIFWAFNTFEIISTSLILATFAFTYIFLNLEKEHEYFNFCIGLIMYLMCSMAIFMSGNTELVFLTEPYIDIWVLNSVFYIVFQYKIFSEYKFFKTKKASAI